MTCSFFFFFELSFRRSDRKPGILFSKFTKVIQRIAMEDLRGILRVLCAENRPCVYTSYAFEPSFSGNCASLCPEGMFSKGNLYCVRDCGAGFYGNTQERSCQKCSSNCKTCLNGEENNLCSSCNSQLFLKGIVQHVTISPHLPPFGSFCCSLRINKLWQEVTFTSLLKPVKREFCYESGL